MTYADLEVDVNDIKVRESKLFGTWSDTNAKAVMKSIAKEQMERDLYDALGTSADLDTVADTYTTHVQRALAYLQLHLFFVDNHTGDGTVNAMKATHYGSLYAKERDRFKTFGGTTLDTTVITAWR